MRPDGSFYDRALETTPWADTQARTLAAAQRQIARVYDRSPFYRAKYDAAGFEPRRSAHRRSRAGADVREGRRAFVAALRSAIGRSSVRLAEEVRQDPGIVRDDGVADVLRIHTARLETCDTIIGRCFYTLGIRPKHTFGLLGNLSMFVGGIPALTAAFVDRRGGVPIGATPDGADARADQL